MFPTFSILGPTSSGRPSRPSAVRFHAFLVGLFVLNATAARGEQTPGIDYLRDVAPILAKRCLACHGAGKQESGLRLDRKDAALKGGESGLPAIAPGKSSASQLIERIASSDLDLRMPPRSEGSALSSAEIATLKRWIDEGATWPQDASAGKGQAKAHWAYIAPVRPTLPSVANLAWPRTPIDHFILARLEREGFVPSPVARREKLLRRLSLDLTGLPPTPEEIDAFLADSHPGAYERQVDRLLASPAYGERWGRLWLDAARYADSNGFEKDRLRDTWVYRDWVVNALNRDLPYDRFIIEQLAGDLIPNATQDQVVATGFLRNSMLNEEGGVDPEQFRMDAMFDRMDAIGKSVLGVTIQCAQCHTHKFDPLTQEEYYRLFAFINNAEEARPAVYSSQDLKRIHEIEAEIAGIEDEIKKKTPDWEKRLAAWENAARSEAIDWEILKADEVIDVGGGAKYEPLDDGSYLAGGWAPSNMTTRYTAQTKLSGVTAIRLEVLTHPSLPLGGPGRSFDGSFALSELSLEVAPAGSKEKPKKIKLKSAVADAGVASRPMLAGEKRSIGPASLAIDGKNDTAWSAADGHARQHADRVAIFELEQPIGFEQGTKVVISLTQAHGRVDPKTDRNNMLGRIRLSLSRAAAPTKEAPLPRSVRSALATEAPDRDESQRRTLFRQWIKSETRFALDRARIEKALDGWPTPTPALALATRPAPRMTTVLKRGDWLKPGKPVTPGAPAFLHPLDPSEPPNRMTFAKWLVDPRSPTTARVVVNRIWQAYFGAGLVTSPEDLGVQCEAPSHPELLDWLACELMSQGWRTKEIHRLIVCSAVYQQSSVVPSILAEKDPFNRLLGRGPRLRVDAEAVRDIALAASGLLTATMGGPSVFPPAPAFLFVPPASYESFAWEEEKGADRFRRGLYTFRRRSTPYPAFAAFDAPTGDFSCVKRARSNTPIQALVTLNEPLFVESAQALALRTLRESPRDFDARVTSLYRRCVGRTPEPPETKLLKDLFDLQVKRFADGWIDPKTVAFPQPESPPTLPEGVTPTELGAWTVLARVVLNLDETIAKE